MRVDLGSTPSPTAQAGSTVTERRVRTFATLVENPGEPRTAAPATRATTGAPPLGALLARAADADRATDGLIAAAARGRTFTPAQLLALQATVSRGAQTVEVVSRAVDRLVGTVKQSLGTQI